jgi:hypothetical protein
MNKKGQELIKRFYNGLEYSFPVSYERDNEYTSIHVKSANSRKIEQEELKKIALDFIKYFLKVNMYQLQVNQLDTPEEWFGQFKIIKL